MTIPQDKKDELVDLVTTWFASLSDNPIPDPDDDHDHEPTPDPDPDPSLDLGPITPTGGFWSNPLNWPGGVLPDENTDVILSGDTIVDGIATVRRLTVESGVTVTLAGELFAHLSVVNYGTLQGTTFQLHFMVADDRLAQGAHGHIPDPEVSGIGLWNMPGGKINFQGTDKTPAVKLKHRGSTLNLVDINDCPMPGRFQAAKAIAGAGEGVFEANIEEDLDSIVGWKTGDHILIVNEKGQHAIGKINHGPMIHDGTGSGTHIRWNHLGGNMPTVTGNVVYRNGEIVAQPRILNLTRSCVIDAPLCVLGDTNHRAHTVALNGSEFTFKNIELRNMGVRGKLGLYPVHIHHGQNDTPAHIEGCSIWQDCGEPGNRWITLHNTHHAKIHSNIGFLSQGAGFFMEDGSEQSNEIIGNFGIEPVGKEELDDVFGDPHRSRIDIAHAFWIWDGNTVRDNFSASYAKWQPHPTGDKIVGNCAGLVIKNHKGMSDVVEGHTHYGGNVGVWAEKKCVFRNLTVYFANRALFPSLIDVNGPEHMVTENSRLLNCNAGFAGYAYPGHEIDNCVVVCGSAALTQGATSDYFRESEIDCNILVTSETAKVGVGFENCNVKANSAWRLGASHTGLYNLFPIVLLKNCSGEIYGEPIDGERYYTRNDMEKPYSLADGFERDSHTWQLHAAPDVAGYVNTNAFRYSLQPIGLSESHQSRSGLAQHNAAVFALHNETYRGYPGHPPGEYLVRGYNGSGTELLGEKVVEIKSGETAVVNFN